MPLEDVERRAEGVSRDPVNVSVLLRSYLLRGWPDVDAVLSARVQNLMTWEHAEGTNEKFVGIHYNVDQKLCVT